MKFYRINPKTGEVEWRSGIHGIDAYAYRNDGWVENPALLQTQQETIEPTLENAIAPIEETITEESEVVEPKRRRRKATTDEALANAE